MMPGIPESTTSVLVIGATGRLGRTLIQQLANHPNRPKIHAFCRNPSLLVEETRILV